MSETEQSGQGKEAPSVADANPPDGSPVSGGPAPQDKPRRRFALLGAAVGFFLLLLLAAACGGLIAVYWPWLTGHGGERAALTGRVGALETRIGELAAGQAPSVAAANFNALKQSLAQLRQRLDADEARLAAVEKTPGAAGSGDVGALKAAIDKNSAAIAQLSERLDKLAAAASTKASTELTGKLAADDKTIAGLRSDLDTQIKASDAALAKLSDRVAALEKTAPPADLSQRLDSFATKTETQALQERVQRLESEDIAGLVHRAAAVMALADLVRASEREQPFANALEAARAIMPSSPELADLARYAQNGVPTTATLAGQFRGDIDSILAAERNAQAHNWAERIWADIVNLISVRRVGNVSGNDTEARVARAEFALDHGDLAAAVHDVEGLDAPAKAAASVWLKQARARLAVNRDARALTKRVVTSLAAARAEMEDKTQTDAQ